jgi:hypothetical protein
MILAKTVLIGFHRPRAGHRGGDETDPDRLELGVIVYSLRNLSACGEMK